MEKYCPKCKKSYSATDKNFCTSCGSELITIANQVSKEIAVIKNKIVWNIPIGEIAYRISEKEMVSLLHATGIVVDEGVTAYIYIDGRLAAEINGGTYDFVSEEELQHKLNARLGGIADRLKDAWKVITRFWVGTSVQERIDRQSSIANATTVDEVVASIRRDAAYSVILKVDKEFPLVFETPVSTAQYNGTVGVGISLRIADFRQFIRQFFIAGGRHSVTNIDVKDMLKATVDECLRSETFAGGQVSDDVRARLLLRLQAKMTEQNFGINVTRVNEITVNSQDLDRLRTLDREIYLSEEELDRLHKINIIKNRINDEEVQQQIEAARGELGIYKIMNEINRDHLIAEDEMEAFVETLSNARKLRTAQKKEEFDAAVHNIRKAQILRDTDIQLLIAESNEKLYQRNTAFSLLQLQDTIHRNKIEQAAGHEMEEADMRHQTAMARIKDAYQDERFLKQLELDNVQFKSSLEQRRATHEQDMVEQKDNISLIGDMLDLQERQRQSDHARQMETLKMLNDQQLEKETLKYKHEETELGIKATMTAEQLTAEQLSRLTPEAQAAYFNNRDKEAAAMARAEAERDKAAFIDRKSTEMTQIVADLARQALSAAGAVAANDRQRAEDYKADLHREQDRYDRHQEQVTKYMLGGNKSASTSTATTTTTSPVSQPQQPQAPLFVAPLKPTSPQVEGRIVKCPKCGKENNLDEGSFCAYCREPLQ